MSKPKVLTPERVIEELRRLADKEGYVTYNQDGIGGIRAAATREFGSWRKACEAAGVKARPQGRPKKQS